MNDIAPRPEVLDTQSGSKLGVTDDLKSLPLPELEKKPGSSPGGLIQVEAEKALPDGLTSGDAGRLLTKFGPNKMPDTEMHPLRMALEKFWAPVPWMLEAAIVLELVLGKYVEAAIIAGLLVFRLHRRQRYRRRSPMTRWGEPIGSQTAVVHLASDSRVGTAFHSAITGTSR
jgi:hypothetical protein